MARPADGTPPRKGEWLWTTREGAERDLVDELGLGGDPEARIFAPAVVLSRRAPRANGRIELTFARQGFPVAENVEASSIAELADEAARQIESRLDAGKGYALHVWVPDSSEANLLSAAARSVEERIVAHLAKVRPSSTRVDTRDVGPAPLPLVHFLK